MKISANQFSTIVERIYEAALAPAEWGSVLELIGRTVDSHAGTVWIHDFSDSSASFDGAGPNIASFVGFEGDAIEKYASYYSTVNVWTAREDSLPAGTAVTSAMLYPNSALKRTEFYGDWLRKNDLFHALGSVVEKEATRAVKMTFLRPEQAGEFDRDQFALMQALMPHIRTAVNVHRRMHAVQAVADAALLALDTLNFGIVLLSSSGTFIHWNATAQNIATRSRAINIGPSGRVGALNTTQSGELDGAISNAVKAGQGLCSYGGSMIRLTGQKSQDIRVFVAPVARASTRFGSGVSAVLFVRETSCSSIALASSLRSIYKLTPAEATLAEALTEGKSLKAFADERGVSLNTVKTQLKLVAAKVGVKRQIDVVREILTGPAVLHSAPRNLSNK